MFRFCRIISAIFSPLLVPTYAMMLAAWLSVLHVLPAAALWATIGIVFLFTAIIPAAGIYAMLRTGMVTDPGLNNRTERTVPYVIVALCYGACGLFLTRAGAPQWLPMFFFGAAVATLVNIVVNRWWKISAHAAAMGGLVAMLFRMEAIHQTAGDIIWWICAAILAAGTVMSARVYMQRHTLMQVLAGAANGFTCVWLMSILQ